MDGPYTRSAHRPVRYLYVLVAASVTVTGLSLLGMTSVGVVLSLILAILALLSVSLLVSREQLSELQKAVDARGVVSPAAGFFVEEDLAQIRERLGTADEAWMWGVTMQTHIPLLVEPLRKGLREGKHYRVMLVKPRGAAIRMAALRAGEGSADDFEHHLEGNLSRVRSLASFNSAGRLEYRLLDYLGPILYVFDPQEESGAIYYRAPRFGGTSDQRPTFWVFRCNDPLWFDRLRDEFEAAWNLAEHNGKAGSM
jgi:hypothetical protein